MSTLYLQCHSFYESVLEFDPESNEMRYKRRSDLRKLVESDLSGRFAMINNRVVLLFRYSGLLYLQCDHSRTEISDSLQVQLVSKNDDRGHVWHICIKESDRVLLDESYIAQSADYAIFDPTPFVEEEDFNFGVLLKNVVSSRDRRDRFYRQKRSRSQVSSDGKGI